MRRIRTKLALSLLIATLLPVIPSYFVVKGLLDRSFGLGMNKKVAVALEEAAGISGKLFAKYKEETLAKTVELAETNWLEQFIKTNGRSNFVLSDKVKNLGNIKIDIFDGDTNLLHSWIQFEDMDYPVLEEKTIQRLSKKTTADVIQQASNPNYISVSSPVTVNGKQIGFINLFRILEKSFSQAAQNVVEVNQMYTSIDLVSEDLKGGFLFVFIIVYASVVLLSTTVGYFYSRRITSPLVKLARGTQKVAEGDWDYRMPVSTKDEIGDLVQAFNKMINTIQEKQRQAREQEIKRRRSEQETLQKTKELELAELNSKVLKAENERKTLELEKAQELEKAYKALEISHHHLQEAQAQLIQSEKMASLGNLAAGVAHEINNPIGAINSSADVSLRAVRKINAALESEQLLAVFKNDQKLELALKILQDNTQLMVTASTRVAKIVKSLKTFARLDEISSQSANIHEGLDSTLMLLQHEIKNRITVEKDYGAIPPIHAYHDQLNQVFMNLLANAAQAIDKKGQIFIHTFMDEKNIFIEIKDTGKGITPEKISKIFDPGFTTKGVGVGTGLGLSISYNIIQKHHGNIRVESEPGKGTTFTIIIPLHAKEGEETL